MLKFLRKYQMWILVVGGVFLMIAFTAPQAVQQFGPDPTKRVVSRMNDGTVVRDGDVGYAAQELAALDALDAYFTGGDSVRLLSRFVLALDEGDRPEHWLLLTHEAQQGGYVGGADDGYSWIPILSEQLTMMMLQRQFGQQGMQFLLQQNPELITQNATAIQQAIETQHAAIAARARLTPEQFDMSLAKARGVLRMFEAYAGASRFSDRRALIEAEHMLEGVRGEAVFIPAFLFTDDVEPPTDEQLAEHFDEFKGVRAAEGDYGFGYLLPPRVKLDWLVLNPTQFADLAPVDRIEIHKRWQARRDIFPGEFTEERDSVVNALRQEFVQEIMREAETAVRTELLKLTRNLTEQDGFKQLPDDWQAPDWNAIAQQVVEFVNQRTGIEIPTPEVVSRTDAWLTQGDLRALPGIGAAGVRVGAQMLPVPALAMNLRELDGNMPLPLQAGLPLGDFPAVDAAQNRYYFTITDWKPESPPDSFEQIREELVEDYTLLAAYRALVERLPDYVGAAIDSGAEALAEQINAPLLEGENALTPEELTRDNSALFTGVLSAFRSRVTSGDARLNVAEFGERLVDHASSLDPLVRTEDLPAAERTVGMELPRSLGVAVATINSLNPLTEEYFRLAMSSEQSNPVRAAAQQEQRETEAWNAGSPFQYDALQKRYAFTPDPDEGEEAPEPEPAEAESDSQ